MFAANLNNEIFKYVLVAGTFPLWFPFFRALWQELNDCLRDEGGLFGKAPTPEELARMNRELGPVNANMVSEPRESALKAQANRRGPRGSRPSPAAPPRASGPSRGGSAMTGPSRGFRG